MAYSLTTRSRIKYGMTDKTTMYNLQCTINYKLPTTKTTFSTTKIIVILY